MAALTAGHPGGVDSRAVFTRCHERASLDGRCRTHQHGSRPTPPGTLLKLLPGLSRPDHQRAPGLSPAMLQNHQSHADHAADQR